MVERSFLESIDDALAEKASLQSQLPEVMSPACAPGEARPGFAWSTDSSAMSLPRHRHSWARAAGIRGIVPDGMWVGDGSVL